MLHSSVVLMAVPAGRPRGSRRGPGAAWSGSRPVPDRQSHLPGLSRPGVAAGPARPPGPGPGL